MKAFLFCALISLSACARPDYINPQQSAQENNNANSQACPLLFLTSNQCARIEWVQGPKSPDESEFIVKFWDKNAGTEQGPFIDPVQSLSIVLWMPSMGHGSSPVKIEKLQDGVFRVRKVYFIMPGDWEIRFIYKNQKLVIDQASLSLII